MSGDNEEDKESKTEAATERKRSDAIEQGNIPVVRDTSVLASVLALFVFCSALLPATAHLFFPGILVFWDQADEIALRNDGDRLALLRHCAMVVILAVGPVILLACLASLALTFLQNPPGLYPARLAPKLGNISIGKGVKRLFGAQALLEFLKSFLKIVVIMVILWITGGKLHREILFTIQMQPESLPGVALEIIGRIVGYIAIALAAFHLGEMFLSRFRWLQELRMSRQELKDEFKHTEGDPLVRARLRSLAQSRARSRMIAAVPEATVILVNPTHYSVALRYKREEGGAPVVVAKGLDHLALRIRTVAEEHRIPVIENRMLARNLYYEVDVGDMIPSDFYRAVAEIIVTLNTILNKGQRRSDAHDG